VGRLLLGGAEEKIRTARAQVRRPLEIALQQMAKGGGHGNRDGAAQSRHHTFASPDRVLAVISPTTTPSWLLDDPLEKLHVDLLAGSDVAGVGAEDDEAVRLRHRRQYS
jgi:hypothetical protein